MRLLGTRRVNVRDRSRLGFGPALGLIAVLTGASGLAASTSASAAYQAPTYDMTIGGPGKRLRLPVRRGLGSDHLHPGFQRL